MKLYNSGSQRIEYVRLSRKLVTVHLGDPLSRHALHLDDLFPYAMADTLTRYLEFQGHRVKTVQHVTSSVGHGKGKAITGDTDWSPQTIRALQMLNIRPPDDCSSHPVSELLPLEPRARSATVSHLRWHTVQVEYNGGAEATPGALIKVQDLLTCYSPDAVRFYLASQHYRRSWHFSWKQLARAAEQARVVAQAATVRGGLRRRFDPTPIKQCLLDALDDDLNTCIALSALLYLADEILVADAAGLHVAHAQSTLRALSWIFGLRLGNPPEMRVVEGWQRQAAKTPEQVTNF